MKITPYKINTIGDFVKMRRKIEFFDLHEINFATFQIKSMGFREIGKSITLDFDGKTQIEGATFQFSLNIPKDFPIGILFQEIMERAIELFKKSEKLAKEPNL